VSRYVLFEGSRIYHLLWEGGETVCGLTLLPGAQSPSDRPARVVDVPPSGLMSCERCGLSSRKAPVEGEGGEGRAGDGTRAQAGFGGNVSRRILGRGRGLPSRREPREGQRGERREEVNEEDRELVIKEARLAVLHDIESALRGLIQHDLASEEIKEAAKLICLYVGRRAGLVAQDKADRQRLRHETWDDESEKGGKR
jgi:hypothetical protein